MCHTLKLKTFFPPAKKGGDECQQQEDSIGSTNHNTQGSWEVRADFETKVRVGHPRGPSSSCGLTPPLSGGWC